MRNKIIGLTICLLFILINFPATAEIYRSQSGIYRDCYIVTSGTMTNRLTLGLFRLGNKALIIYMNMGYKQDGNTFIYNKENGDLLSHEQGEHSFIVIFFRGNYSYYKDPDTGSIFVAMDGLTLIARV